MEEITDFDTWYENYQLPDPIYSAVFDPDTGRVISVGPSHAFEKEKHKVIVERDIAELIIEGKIKIGDCIVDRHSNTLEMVEIKNIFKIDDVLHRIISKEWTEIEKPDIYITYDSAKKTLKFELTEEYAGTKKLEEKYQPITPRKILWDGDTVLNFLVTDYNDPNVLYKMISLKISDMVSKSKIIRGIETPAKFSVYTRRVFKNYVIEYK
jgi:hypothetical protein